LRLPPPGVRGGRGGRGQEAGRRAGTGRAGADPRAERRGGVRPAGGRGGVGLSVGQVDLDAGCLAPGGLDLDRMRAERTARLRAQMEQQGVDVLVLLHGPHVTYATGAPLLAADSSHANFVRPVAVVVAGQDVVHLFTPDPDPVPGTVAHPQAWVMLDEGVERFAAQLREVAGDLDGRVVGVDELTGAMTRARDHLFGGARLVDASMVIGAAKITKT